MDYTIIKSNRRTFALEIKGDGLIVRAPSRATNEEINAFISKHKRWVENNILKMKKRKELLDSVEPLSKSDMQALADKAVSEIPDRVKHYVHIAASKCPHVHAGIIESVPATLRAITALIPKNQLS